MHAVGLRELKNRLSEYVRLVRAGEVILVTDRGVVVAELRPPGRVAPSDDLPPGLLDLAGRGVLKLGSPRKGRSVPRMTRLVPDGTAERLLDEERGER